MGTGDFKNADKAETTVTLGWILERGVREHRVGTVRAQASLAAVDRDVLRLDVAAETARGYLAVLEHQARRVVAQESVDLADRAIAAVKGRVDAGRSPAAELARARAALATAKLARDDVAHELSAARHRLAAHWGSLEPDFREISGDAFALPAPVSFSDLREQVRRSPDIERLLSSERTNEAELRLAQAMQRPAWHTRLGVRRFEDTNDHALVAGITIPITTQNRNQGRIAEANSLVTQSRADTAAARVRSETTLFVLHEALSHSLHRAHAMRVDVIPQIEIALAETESAYERGRYGFYELSVVQADVIAARNELIQSSIDAQRNVVEIERLTGESATSHVPAR